MNRLVRATLQRLSRGVVLQRRLPVEFGDGQVFVTPESMLRYWRRDLWRVDEHLLANVLALVPPKASIWDVGANVGLFGFAAGGRAGPEGRVLLLEPDQELIRLLRRSAAKPVSGRAKIEVLPVAAADEVSVAHLHVACSGRAMNYLDGGGAPEARGAREQVLVVTVTLDWLLDRFRAPDVLKIDVEGAELRVLRGAHRLLRDVRPTVICEVFPENAEAVTVMFKEHRYRMYDGNSPQQARRPTEAACWNTLAVPEETLQA